MSLLALVLGLSAASAAQIYEPRAVGDLSFEAPKGWTVETTAGETAVFFGSKWFDAAPRTEGWAHIDIKPIALSADLPLERPHLRTGRPNRTCGEVRLRSSLDYRNELDCAKPQSCRPCPDKKCPRPPVGGHCGRLLKVMPAGGAKGFLYQAVLDPADRYREAILIVTPAGSKNLYRLEYHAPEDEYKRRWPEFQHLAETFTDNHRLDFPDQK